MQLRRSVLIALMIILIIYFEIHSCSEDRSVSPEPLPEIESVLCNANDIFFLDEECGWIVGQQGTIMLTIDGGENWTAVREQDHDIRSITFIDRDNGWFVGKAGQVYNSEDGGHTWARRLFPAYPQEDDFYQVEFKSEEVGFILGYQGVFVTDDGGNDWENNWLPVVPARGAWNMSMVDDNCGYLLGSRWTDSDPQLLYRTDDGGINWLAVEGSEASVLRSVLTIEFVDSETGWAGGGVIMKTLDGGRNWQTQREEATVREFCFMDDQTGFAVGSNSILKTINGGDEWIDISLDDERVIDLRGVYFLDDQKGWVVGRSRDETIGDRIFKYSILLSTVDGGMTWVLKEFAFDITEFLVGSAMEEE